MIFKQIPDVLDGRKTQTRRLFNDEGWSMVYSVVMVGRGHKKKRVLETLMRFDAVPKDNIYSVYSASGALKWRVGSTYAIQPARGQKGVGKIVIESIKLEKLHDISKQDAIAEGIWQRPDNCWTTSIWEPSADCFSNPVGAYARLWDSINTPPGTRWANNPLHSAGAACDGGYCHT